MKLNNEDGERTELDSSERLKAKECDTKTENNTTNGKLDKTKKKKRGRGRMIEGQTREEQTMVRGDGE